MVRAVSCVSGRKTLSWSWCCRVLHTFFSPVASWLLCLGEALKRVFQGVKGETVGSLPVAKEEISEHHLKCPLVHVGLCSRLSVFFPIPSHTVFVGANSSTPPLSSVF